jgi:mannose-6-phosphate isomerase-like protein (cupin superfamily)
MSDGAVRGFQRFFGEWIGRLPTKDGKPFVVAHEHGTLKIELFAPRGVDTQSPHSQDEVYVVVSGAGHFVSGPNRAPFGPGDLLFVPAGVEHHFEDFTNDLAVWVIFYGPEGGEAAQEGQSP